MSLIDDAIVKIQTHALLVTYDDAGKNTIRSAPNYPVESAAVLPLAVTYIGDGECIRDNNTDVRLLYTIFTDIHVDPKIMKSAFSQINNIIPDLERRLAGDPTLTETVDTIRFPITHDEPSCALWNDITTLMVRFRIPIKIKTTPTN